MQPGVEEEQNHLLPAAAGTSSAPDALGSTVRRMSGFGVCSFCRRSELRGGIKECQAVGELRRMSMEAVQKLETEDLFLKDVDF